MGQTKLQPAPQRSFVTNIGVDVDEPTQLAVSVNHGLSCRFAKRGRFVFLTDPKHEPPNIILMASRPAKHVPVHEKAHPTHHPFLGNARMRDKLVAHALVKTFVNRHQKAVTSCQRMVSESTSIVNDVMAAPIRRPLLSTAARRPK